MFEIYETLFIHDIKILSKFKPKLTDSELWTGGGNARFNSSTVSTP